jgi:hypothetical protein
MIGNNKNSKLIYQIVLIIYNSAGYYGKEIVLLFFVSYLINFLHSLLLQIVDVIY